MGLDNIQLSPVTIQQLFNKSLVQLQSNESAKEKTTAASLSILGKNNSNTVIVVNNADVVHLPDDELNFLLGILAACKLTMEDVGILNLHRNKGADYNSISGELKAEKVFLFGVEPQEIDLPLAFPHYQVQHYNSQVYLFSPALNQLKENKAEKIKLWTSLKQIFAV